MAAKKKKTGKKKSKKSAGLIPTKGAFNFGRI